MATIKDVAKLAGVSTATVSMIINNKAPHISKETKERVNDAISELRYSPNLTARGLVSSKTKTIGLILPDITNPFFSELAKNIESCFIEAGYITFLCNTGEDGIQEARCLSELLSRSVDGMLLCGLREETVEKLSSLQDKKIPYLLFDTRVEQKRYCIKIDDYLGGQMAARYFKRHHHKDVAFVGPKSLPRSTCSNTPVKRVQAPISKKLGINCA